ncbi:MAG: hypothetical protein IT395_06295 [Candidatus Omnitrophica bacterium]|nr:hypothetical protein [Candidatus Omnitrophota bacterium]
MRSMIKSLAAKNEDFRKWDIMRMIVTVSCLYLLAPNLDRRVGFMISLAFALLNIFAARLLIDMKHWGRATAYIAISIVTYYILFSDQPWNFLHQGGIFDASPLPLIVCSVIMTLAGWLLLKGWRAKFDYVLITLGLQIPIGLFVGGGQIQHLFSDLSLAFHYDNLYLDSWAIWQFEWMATYHLPLYFLSHIQQRQKK